MTRPDHFTVIHHHSRECHVLTRAELEQFFNARNPRDWTIR